MRWIAGGLRCFVLWIGLAAAASTAGAGQVSVSQDADLFGDQENRGELCAPTATANSFRYLENTSSRYRNDQGENLLTGDDLEGARDDLAENWMGLDSYDDGATPQEWWEGMTGYMEEKAPDQTRYKGMVAPAFDGDSDPADWNEGSNVESAIPTFEWLFGELEDDEAVQLGLFKSATEGHAVSLTGLSFEDDNGDGQWDAGSESAEIDYIDPDNPGEVTTQDLGYNAEGYMGFGDYAIGLAYSESPVPLPGTMALLVMGIAGAGGLGWLRRCS